MMTHKKGEYLLFSSGECSDYGINGLYRALQDIDLADLARRYYDAAPVCEWDEDRREASDTGFGAWLTAHRLVKEISYDEVHCGNYGQFDVSEVAGYADKRGRELASRT